MSYFRNFFGGGVSSPEEENGAEIVERLVERLETCDDIEDRRDALRTLRSMARKLRVAVGSMGMNAFMEIIDKERSCTELLSHTLEILNAILTSDDDTTDEDELGERLTEVLLKKSVFIPSLLASVEIFDFSVRRASIQLFTSILRHRGSEVQQLVISQPSGVSILLDSIHDTREVVRNEAILMLCELSRNNSQIQQLLAYDNAFTAVMDIIQMEPLDSIVVEDCLFVILNLLRKNSMNQAQFRENNLIVRLHSILNAFLMGQEENEEVEWSKQRTANLIFLLQVVMSLVSPDNNVSSTHAAQKAIYHSRMLATLCQVFLSESGVSVEILTESVVAVAECIRGSYTNQEFFASCSLPVGEHSSRPSLLVLLSAMTSEKQPFKLRCAVFYCFLSYLYDNEFGKTKIIETLLSNSPSDSSLTTGGMVVQALSALESVQSWFGSVSLMHCLFDVPHLREQLLRVQLSIVRDQPAVSLLRHISNQLISYGNRRVQTRVGLLMLICTWLNDCPQAVDTFTENQDAIHYLTTQIVDESGEGTESEQQILKGLMAFVLLSCLNSTSNANERSSLEQLIERRIGREKMVNCLEGVSRTEQFVRAAQKPQPLAKLPSELFLDFQFIKLFKSCESSYMKLVVSKGDFNGTNNSDGIIQSFKGLIKRQDEEIAVLKHDLKRLNAENDSLKQQEPAENPLEAEVNRLKSEIEQLKLAKVEQKPNTIEIEEAQRIATQWQCEAEKYKQWATQWQQYQISQLPNPQDEVVAQFQQQLAHVDQQLYYGYAAFEQQTQQLAQQTAATESFRQRAEELERQLNEALQTQTKQNGIGDSTEFERLKSEQDDLLMLLADQHNKITIYRQRLRMLKEVVSDDEDD